MTNVERPSKFPYSTKQDVDNFWLKWGDHYQTTIRKDIYKDQEEMIVKLLRQEFDLSKIETVLDVGCGYGRIARLVMPLLINLKKYVGLDISSAQIKNALIYVHGKGYEHRFEVRETDFENYSCHGGYDLVICVETMTVMPYNVQYWIDKLIDISKKYILTLDWYDKKPNPPVPISQINTWHDYPAHYKANPNIIWAKGYEIPKYTEHIFLVRVK